MIVIMISATLVNYGLFGVMSGIFGTVEGLVGAVQINILSSVVIIGITIFIMFILIPKEKVDSILIDLDKSQLPRQQNQQQQQQQQQLQLTPDEELTNMLDEELEDEKK